MSKFFTYIVFCSSLVCQSSMAAEMTIDTYEKLINGSTAEKTLAESYVDALGTGYSWANTHLEKRKSALLFCYPGAINKEFFNKHLKEGISTYLSRGGPTKQVPLSVVLLYKLEAAFPCKK